VTHSRYLTRSGTSSQWRSWRRACVIPRSNFRMFVRTYNTVIATLCTEFLNTSTFAAVLVPMVYYAVCLHGLMFNLCQQRQRTFYAETKKKITVPPRHKTEASEWGMVSYVLITLRTSCGAVYCNRPCLSVGGCGCGSVTTITWNCMHRSSPNWVCR